MTQRIKELEDEIMGGLFCTHCGFPKESHKMLCERLTCWQVLDGYKKFLASAEAEVDRLKTRETESTRKLKVAEEALKFYALESMRGFKEDRTFARNALVEIRKER